MRKDDKKWSAEFLGLPDGLNIRGIQAENLDEIDLQKIGRKAQRRCFSLSLVHFFVA